MSSVGAMWTAIDVAVAVARGLRERRGVLDRPALLDPLAERRAVALGQLLHGQRTELPTSA